jgi:hypothetical protein
MKKSSELPTPSEAEIYAEQVRAAGEALVPKVRALIGEGRLARLQNEPRCLANGGLDAVLQTACEECCGYEKPEISALVRALGLCGFRAKPQDLEKSAE